MRADSQDKGHVRHNISASSAIDGQKTSINNHIEEKKLGWRL